MKKSINCKSCFTTIKNIFSRFAKIALLAYFILLGVGLVSCGFHGCWVKENSDLCFDCSIESGTLDVIDLHMWFVYTGF